MAEKSSENAFPELRDYVSENESDIYTFILFLIGERDSADELSLRVFREFGSLFRKRMAQKGAQWDPQETRWLLFRTAWDAIRRYQGRSGVLDGGRDLRELQDIEADLLQLSGNVNKEDLEFFATRVRSRLLFIDPDFRAPVVLRDIIGMEDVEAMRILGLRWGVYRHRLHRGRMESVSGLRGQEANATLSRRSKPLETGSSL